MKGAWKQAAGWWIKAHRMPTVRENVEEGKRRNRRLSSQNLNGTGRKKGAARGSIAWKVEKPEVR